MLFEGSERSVGQQLDAARKLVGGDEGEPWAEVLAFQARAGGRQAFAGLDGPMLVRAGEAFVEAEADPAWSPLAERVRVAFDPQAFLRDGPLPRISHTLGRCNASPRRVLGRTRSLRLRALAASSRGSRFAASERGLLGREPRLIEQELLDACTHCGFCLPTCPTYGALWQQEADSPRGRIYLMQGLLDGSVALTAGTAEHFDRCLGCMACVTACPSGVQYDRLIEQTRDYVEQGRERSPDEWLVRALIFGTVPHPRRLRQSFRWHVSPGGCHCRRACARSPSLPHRGAAGIGRPP